MPRRKKGPDPVILVMELVPLLFLLFWVSPELRSVVQSGAYLVVIVSVIVVIGFLAWMLFRAFTAQQSSSPSYWKYLESSSEVSALVPQLSQTPSRTLRERLRAIDWYQFEQLMGLLFETQGYFVQQKGGARPDGGIDLIIVKDGIQKAVQCKHWQSWNVGVRHIRELLGALADSRISEGVLVTLCGYTQEAKELASKHRIEILDETDVTELLRGVGADYDSRLRSILNDTQKYCPRCGSRMVLRTAGKGRNVGAQFWGCSTYPRCKCIVEYNENSTAID